MSYNKGEEDKEDFKVFYDLLQMLNTEIELTEEPSKEKIRKILKEMLRIIK